MREPDRFIVRVFDLRGNVCASEGFETEDQAKRFASHAVAGPGIYAGAALYQRSALAWTPVNKDVAFAPDPDFPKALTPPAPEPDHK